MKSTGKPARGRAKSASLLWISAAVLGSLPTCLSGTQFRAAALPAFQSGVSQILDGFVSGVFAAIAVEPDNSSGTSTSP